MPRASQSAVPTAITAAVTAAITTGTTAATATTAIAAIAAARLELLGVLGVPQGRLVSTAAGARAGDADVSGRWSWLLCCVRLVAPC